MLYRLLVISSVPIQPHGFSDGFEALSDRFPMLSLSKLHLRQNLTTHFSCKRSALKRAGAVFLLTLAGVMTQARRNP